MTEYKLILMRQDNPFCMRLEPFLFAIRKEARWKPVEVNLDILLIDLWGCFCHFMHKNELEGIVSLQHH